MGRDGTEWDELFHPTFGAPKNCGTGCPMGQNLADFLFHLFPLERPVPPLPHGTTRSTFVEHKFITFYDKISPYLFQYLHHPFRPVPSRPVCIPNGTLTFGYPTKDKFQSLTQESYGRKLKNQ